MWIWDQSSGELRKHDKVIAKGYSGFKEGKNNPSMQGIRGIGPIPSGMWEISGKYDSVNVGKYALILEPINGTDTKGRRAFRIHGDSIRNPGTASHGCIILPRDIRVMIWESGDRLLKVVE